MAEIHDSTRVAQNSPKTAGDRDAAASLVTGVSGRLPDVEPGTLGALGGRITLLCVTAVLVGVGVLGVLGLVAVVPGGPVAGLFSVVALLFAAAAGARSPRVSARVIGPVRPHEKRFPAR